jgi:hypothetical protein
VAIPDITALTLPELRELLTQVTYRVAQVELNQQEADAQRRVVIQGVIQPLTDLLGPVGAQPGVGSIREVRAFDAADAAAGKPRGTTMAENPALALSLLYEGMEILAANALNLSNVVANGE